MKAPGARACFPPFIFCFVEILLHLSGMIRSETSKKLQLWLCETTILSEGGKYYDQVKSKIYQVF